jgi:organic radical activating enzyme
MLRISEVFWSAQGEGLASGAPAVFLRLAGCSLRCPYCDTRRAWTRGRPLSVEAALAAVAGLMAAQPRSRLVLTGGEPLEQDLGELADACRRRRWFTALETSGLHFQDLPLDWWTVSPKDIAAYRVHPRLWERVGELKLLVTPALELAVVKRLRRRTAAPIFLQPQRRDRQRYRRAFTFFRECSQAGIPDVRLGAQLHAVFRIP